MGFFDWLSRLFRPDSDAPPTPRPPALPRQQRRNKTAPHQTRQPRGARAASRGSALSPEPSGPVEQAQLALTRALSEPARAEGFAQLRAANGPGSPAEQLGSSFVLQLLPTVEGLQGPAVVIGYVDPADCPSAVPEILKGRHLSIHLEHEGKQRRLIVMNENSGESLSAEPAGPGDGGLPKFAECLHAAGGLHIVALARANEPVVVRDAWERSGSIELTGDVLRAVDARRQGRTEDALTLLRQAASADDMLAGANRLMSLILRDDLGKGDCPEVRELLETERRRAPRTGMAKGSLGILAKRADDFEQAASLLEASLALQPNDIGHLMTLANVYVCQGGDDSIDRLIDILSRVNGLAPEDDRLSTFLARLKAETGVDLEIAVRTRAIDCSVH